MSNILVFNKNRHAITEKSILDEIEEMESLIKQQLQDKKQLINNIFVNQAKLRELKNNVDSNINKIAFRKILAGKAIERVRILSLTYGDAYHAIKINRDNSDSTAKDRFKRIYLNNYQGWTLE